MPVLESLSQEIEGNKGDITVNSHIWKKYIYNSLFVNFSACDDLGNFWTALSVDWAICDENGTEEQIIIQKN